MELIRKHFRTMILYDQTRCFKLSAASCPLHITRWKRASFIDIVSRCILELKRERTSIENDPLSGKLATAFTEGNNQKV